MSETLELAPALAQEWQAAGYQQATAIQKLIMGPLAQGQSLVAISPTGSGKTLAYLLPVLGQLQAGQGLQALILAPSQELAKQIAGVAQTWGGHLDLKVQLVVGGANFKRQQEALKAKPEIIVATPGRFLELANQTRKLKVHQVRYLILDEADYLLQAEHEGALHQIRKSLMRDVTVAWISATYGQPLVDLVASGLPLYQVEKDQVSQSGQVNHVYVLTHDRQKVQQLKRLAQVADMQALVFFEQVHDLETVAAKLVFQGIKVAVMHGQLSKQERERAFRLVQQGKVTYMLTTDMAARGLDIPDLPYIIHYNRVDSLDTYVHRSGRTGRMGKSGTVLSLVNEQELRDLERLLAASPYQLSERITFKGQLVGPQERAGQQDQEGLEGPKAKPKTGAKPARKAKAAVATKPKKKKDRHRDSKNKGKRKAKA